MSDGPEHEMQFDPRPGDPAPRRIRRLGRLGAVFALAVMFIALLWVFTGLPAPVASAMNDALWAPCPAQYAAARTSQDSALADGYVLRPRTRFEKAITCGTERQKRPVALNTPNTPNTLSFAVFGDAPYYAWESMRYRRALREIDEAHVAWLLHVGDLFWRPCSDDMMAKRRAEFDSMATAVVYVPGDNEWTDCHTSQTGSFEPLGRLAQLRKTLLPSATQSLGRTPIVMESQASQAPWREFAEHRRWRRGRVMFATLHLVGSDNGLAPFPTRTKAHDDEVLRRSAAALQWMRETFDSASAQNARLVVLAWHGNPGFSTPSGSRHGYDAILDTLRVRAATFNGEILVIHGDSHDQHVDQPLSGADGKRLPNVTRLETFGSPVVGWVNVAVDTLQGRVSAISPHAMTKRAFIF